MQESILPIDCRGCTRSTAIVANTITIDLANTGSPSIDEHETGTYFDRLWLAILRSKILLTTSTKLRTPPRIAGIRQCYKEYFLKLMDNICYAFLHFMCNGYNLSQFLNLTSDCKRNDRLIVQLFHKIFLHYKFVNSHVVCRHVQTYLSKK